MKKVKSNNRHNVVNTRKVIRKQKRQQKKLHRQEHYMKKKTETNTPQERVKYTPGRFVKRPADETDIKSKTKKKKPNIQSVHDILNKERKKEKDAADRLKSQMEEQRRKIFLAANEDEDKVIKKLEKQLGLNKSKNKNNYFADDGLDYLLEICDRSTTEQIVAAEKHLAEVEGDSDFEEDLAVVTGKELKDTKERKKNSSLHDNLQSEDDEIQSEDDDVDDGADIEDDASDSEEFGDLSGDESDAFEEDSDSEAPEEKPTKSRKSADKKAKINAEEPSKKKEMLLKPKEQKQERIISADDLSKVFSDDEVSHLSGDDDDLEGFSGDENENGEVDEVVEKKSEEKPDVWEDIYGRKRDKEGNIIKEEKGVYIPPHLRDKDGTSDKQLIQLKRQIKSVLNKLSGTNLHWACSAIEQLYSSNSRHAVNSSLTQLWLEALVQPSATPDRMVAEHVALIAVLHANVGSEIGAHFLQELTKRADALIQTPQPVHDKHLDNLISCLAHLYSFKMYHASLLYDVLDRLMGSVCEKHIECIVVCLRCVGGGLRRDEPRALRAALLRAQDAMASLGDDAHTGSRLKFLVEVLTAVKNNNLTKIPNYDPSYTEHLRKAIRAVIRKGNYITPLNIRLEDLLKAEERGKWWVVGSAWEGSRVVEDKPVVAPALDDKLLQLARQQRMNTDVRRTIFCVIMAAQDYMDAFEKLQHLGLKGQQEREIVHVLLACCLQEKTYNPYYAVLGQKLCDYDRKYQLSIQFAVWDKIKDIENMSKQAVTNLAQFLIHLIMEKGLALSVLKVIQFSELNKHTVKFMRQILLAIIMNADLQASLQTFHRVSKPPKLQMFRESLRLFIQHFLIKNAGKKSSILSEDDMATLRERALEVDKILTLHESKLKF